VFEPATGILEPFGPFQSGEGSIGNSHS
jgi:hypothetical protein